jgi:hypothetical protein
VEKAAAPISRRGVLGPAMPPLPAPPWSPAHASLSRKGAATVRPAHQSNFAAMQSVLRQTAWIAAHSDDDVELFEICGIERGVLEAMATARARSAAQLAAKLNVFAERILGPDSDIRDSIRDLDAALLLSLLRDLRALAHEPQSVAGARQSIELR